MNRLVLVNRLATECGVTGSASSISTTLAQTGEAARLVNWIDQAWVEIQEKNDDWEWMRSSNILGLGASFVTVAGQSSYPLGTTGMPTATTFGKWKNDTFRLYLTTAGTSNETDLEQIGFDQWRNGYMMGAMRAVTTRPIVVAIGPDKSLCLGPPPTVGYTVTGDYYLAPSSMAADADLPTGLPTQFHMAIVYLAMTYYAGYEAAPEVLSRGQGGYETMMRRLEMLHAPEIGFSGALA